MNPIEQFVRGTLGCQCPDEVFRSIEIEHLRTSDDTTSYARLVVGERLLIYVLDAASTMVADGALAHLVARGRGERDERGYNRFRLVVAHDDPDRVNAAAREEFDRAASKDERAHLHVIPPGLLPAAVMCGLPAGAGRSQRPAQR